ncbi:ATP-binding cassette sub-family C member 4-like isoform X1 [Onthophagus taurus]|uniref:ATP-binding cassette sub-family C member 4-like isoform X1 n=2 Tax=Onthophagus taurus TaxID=166361 RepID=UPI0039BE04AF
MDITKETYNPNPREKANCLSVLLFTYTIGMFKKGYSKTLETEDLYSPLSSDKSQTLGDRLERKWLKHLDSIKKVSKKPSLLKVLVATFWPEYLYLGFLLVIMDLGLRLAQPMLLGNLLDYFRPDTTTTKNQALIYAGAVVLSNAGSALLINQYIMGAFHYGMKVRAACCALIYRKALRLSNSALGQTASGQIVNLLSNDVSRFDIVSVFIHHMWVAPTSAIIVTYFLWVEAGVAGIIGIIPVFLVVPLQSYTGKLSSRFRRQTAYKTDERVRLMDEIISGVQVIKMYAWELPFANLIKHARKMELKIITKLSYVRGLFMTFNLFTTRVALFCTLITMVLLYDQKITAAKVFVVMSYYNIMSQTMSAMFVRGISEMAELFVSIKRLQNFLLNAEFIDATKSTNTSSSSNNNTAIDLKNLTASWSPESSKHALSNLNLCVEKGSLIGVIGPVGSGKSSLLHSMLGELHVVSGNIMINGTISYASQEPWVFAATIRQNIVFGQKYDRHRYNDVVRVCALEKDFKQFPDGDLTIVGDRGASLSGGQKARINLARAIYRDADIYLLDDPLSAVDVHVAKHLYQDCINGYLKNKTRILVTHQVNRLKDVTIVILDDGNIVAQGSFQELANTDLHYAKILTQDPESLLSDEEKLKEKEKLVESVNIHRKTSTRSKTLSLSSAASESSIVDSLMQEEEDKINAKDYQEDTSRGKVKGSLGLHYLLAGGNICFVTFVAILYILAQAAASGVDFFVGYWVNIEEIRSGKQLNLTTTNVEASNMLISTYMCIYIYAGLVIGLFVIALTRSMLFYKLAMLASQKLHDNMFMSVIYTSMRFFDLNPSGRILNRFSKDIGSVDELLPKVILDAAQIILLMFGSLVLVAIVNYMFLIPVAVIAVVFMFLRVVFLRSSKNIKRLEGMMRSPVFTHLNATLQGLTTIRSNGAQDTLRYEFDKHQDLHTSAWFMYISASSAFGFYLDCLCFLFTALVTFSFLTLAEGLYGGDVGLAITQATALTGLVQWGMRQSAEVANQLMSVERLLEYSSLPEEQQPMVPRKPPLEWPDDGKLVFNDMGLRYSDDSPLVLRNLDIVVEPKEKVGIVGRTGAGKSSLIAALFRLASIEGEIHIDNINTAELNLQLLRSKISIIPQDPVLFSGTLRYNLDPFEEYSDQILYKALNEVELKDPENIINKLENRVMDRGKNYSVGQRQLICLARAIVRKNKILMLDEATANVDPQTDAVIQKTIRQKFADCTVLTVAHRLDTIMDSDKVLVMESGRMVEYDHPYKLLQIPDGKFHKMVAQAGKAQKSKLEKVARNSYDRKYGLPE